MLSESTAAENPVSNASWYALYTRHQHEKMVDQVLTNKGFSTFLPLYATSHNWKDRTKALSLPLFPCYVFLKGGIERRLQILTTPGIYGLVSSAGQPAPIPDIEIEAIRRVVESGARVEAHPYLKCGNWVRVKCGPLTGIEGILVRKKNISRLVLSVEILGTAAAIEVAAFQVEAVKGPRQRDSSNGPATSSGHIRAEATA
ncbi:MAG TPA: UpxY family transcription antiterminator [Terriglobales bacterium]|jgi:transcription antitermination factor NusG|nr:UpxY family transcription antiterminator [Terriglobales bacterium]